MTVLRRRLEQRGTTPGDAVLAVSLTVLSLADFNRSTVDMLWPAVGVSVPVILSLAWRRRAPLTTMLAICFLNLLLSATAPGEFGPQLVLLPLLVSVASAAANLEGRGRVWFGGTASLGLMWAATAATGDGDVSDFLPLVLWAGPWTAGRFVRHRIQEVVRVTTESALLAEQRDAETREAIARERDRIARELHDVVAHSVSLMVVQAGAERLSLDDTQRSTRTALASIELAGRQALQELRTMLAVLRDTAEPAGGTETLSPQPTLNDVATLVSRVREAGLAVDLHISSALPDLPPGLSLAAYRVTQEALTNVLKHAPGPTSVDICCDASRLILEVRNPFTAQVQLSADGRGLVGMRERIVLHGGELQTGAKDGQWVVRASLPLMSLSVPAP